MIGSVATMLDDAAPRVIDAHVHVWSHDTLAYPFGPHDGLAAPTQPRTADQFRADGGAAEVLLIQPRVYGYDHGYLFDSARRFGRTARVMPLINIVRQDSNETIRRLAAQEATAGFRIIALGERPAQWLCSPQAGLAYTLATQLNLPVGMLVDPHQLSLVEQIATRHPELNLVIDHAGRCSAVHIAEFAPRLRSLAKHPNVYIKLSALDGLSEVGYPYRDMWPLVASLYQEYGPSRLLWGSDWPHVQQPKLHGRTRSVIRQALPAAPCRDYNAISATTAAQLFGFSPVDVPGGTDGNP